MPDSSLRQQSEVADTLKAAFKEGDNDNAVNIIAPVTVAPADTASCLVAVRSVQTDKI